MRIGIFGTGAVGGFYGGMLVKHGADVVFIARGKTLEKISKEGLTIKSFKYGEFTVPVKATNDPKEAGPVDVVLVCVKAYDTANVAPLLPSMLKPDSAVISVQNGIENEEILAKAVGEDKVLGGVCFIGVHEESPGVVVHETMGFLEIGEFSLEVTPRVQKIVDFLKSHGIKSWISKDIHYSLWKKLLWNVAFNPYSVITRASVGKMLEMEETQEVLENLMQECLSVAKAWGIKLKSSHIDGYLQSTPEQYDYKTSMLVDFERGKPLELDQLTGALLRKAKEKGIEVPYNQCIYNTVKFLVAQRDGKT